MSSKPIRNFSEMVNILNRGRFTEKLDEHLTKACETLEALPGESGKATLTVAITLVYESGRYEIRPSVKTKLPEEKAFAGTTFFALEGGLSLQHPSQSDMFAGPRDVSDRLRDRDAS